MKFFADMHIHSRYSRATSRDCNLVDLARAAARKGILVLGTGDFTHPAWFRELQEGLEPASPGLFRLKKHLAAADGREEGRSVRDVLFVLQVEISTIYKKDGRTRKVHHVIYAPSFEAASRLRNTLDRIGNIESDGRPILGLDSRDLLEIVLESDSGAYLIPAHIWTPWFSVLGDKSGFESIEECYGDLAEHIFAVETGLSSDPPMNWRVSSLDRYRLVSNSDAHSPAKLGREACVFDCEPDYFAIRRALETGDGYLGTVEFFPEEGKYHYDGHRKCNICLPPAEARKLGGRCPVCGKPLTVGVMHRVEDLADRPAGIQPAGAAPFRSFIPLQEIIAEIEGVGSQSRRVLRTLETVLERIGPELFVLDDCPLEEIRLVSPLLAEAVRRMRSGQVIKYPGYDGNYGLIRLFEQEELKQQVSLLFELPAPAEIPPPAADHTPRPSAVRESPAGAGPHPPQARQAAVEDVGRDPLLGDLDADQLNAVTTEHGRVGVIAGPGTGKTHTLTRRIAWLVGRKGVRPEEILALTFTRRAAAEMGERIASLLGAHAQAAVITTFHGLAWRVLQEHSEQALGSGSVRVAAPEEVVALLQEARGLSRQRAASEVSRVERLRRMESWQQDSRAREEVEAYRSVLRTRGLVDFTDLIVVCIELLETHAEYVEALRQRFHWVFVDEFQDIDRSQYHLLKLLVPPSGNLFIIGDPEQSIYGFRGADPQLFETFFNDYPDAVRITLRRNYRSTGTIVEGAVSMVRGKAAAGGDFVAVGGRGEKIVIHRSPTDRAEAEFVAATIERLLGGATFFSLDSGRATGAEEYQFSFADFAVLFRTAQQAEVIVEALSRLGIPHRVFTGRPLLSHPIAARLLDLLEEAGAHWGAADVEEKVNSILETLKKETSDDGVEPLAAHLQKMLAAGGSFDELRAALVLGTETDLWDPRADSVSLLTLHAAKGLEFPVVFIVGCEDGIIPLRFGSDRRAVEIDEERRLFFVGMTRAERLLLLSHADRRRWRGGVRSMRPSPFLQGLRESLIDLRRTDLSGKRPQPRQQQLGLALDFGSEGREGNRCVSDR